jgi:hypothetical protein
VLTHGTGKVGGSIWCEYDGATDDGEELPVPTISVDALAQLKTTGGVQ